MMIPTPKITITDPLYDNQWHFDLMGDIEAIWEDYSGVGVNVAVYDDGMDTDHPDLNDNYDSSLHYPGDNGLFNTSGDGHGTAVGGLIGAENNGIGGVGVAWGVTLTSVDYLNDVAPGDFFFDAVEYAQNFDIVNQSYGFGGANIYSGFLDIGDPGSQTYNEGNATYFAVQNGRDGLGTIFVKAAGNDANSSFLQSNFGNYGNAQSEGMNNAHYVITVGALVADGTVANYSNYGANLLISAGAGSVTTDIVGSGGYDSGSYTNTFGGTSAATPVVSGVIALMLEANPDLGYRDVQNILAISAMMTGSELGEGAQGWEAGEWMSLGGTTWNGGAMTFNLSYGYGAIDAYAAVRMAEIWSFLTEFTPQTADNEITQFFTQTVGQTIPNDGSVSTTITVNDGIIIEHVYVTVDFQHDYLADVKIELIAPDGSVIVLFDGEGGGISWNEDWTFGVAALRGMSSEGDWTIRISDDYFLDDGTFFDAQLEFIGTNETADDVWHFTNDYLDLLAVEADRGQIGNDDGGDDTINLVGVTGNANVTLGAGESIFINGVEWAEITSDDINSVLAGDGDDVLVGDDSENGIWAGRGNDRVEGGAGADQMAGNEGDDLMLGDKGAFYGTDDSATIYRLFSSVFGREPDDGGHQAWVFQLTSGAMTLDDIAAFFVNSTEFQLTYGATSNTEFVTLLYQNIFGRDPDDAGLNGWVGNIEGGMSRAEVVRRLSESAENLILTSDALESYIENHDPTEYMPRIYRLYEGILGREADEGGFLAWVENFENGMDFETAISFFMASPEFTTTFGTTTDEEFVTLLYNNVLGREPDSGGLNGWLSNLANGMSREKVVELFVDGPEFINNTADALKTFILNLDLGDVISAGAGNDIVSGGGFADVFVFNDDDHGNTTITDWEAWDFVDFNGFGYADAAEALTHFFQQGDDTVFLDNGVSIVFSDTNLNDITLDQILIGQYDFL